MTNDLSKKRKPVTKFKYESDTENEESHKPVTAYEYAKLVQKRQALSSQTAPKSTPVTGEIRHGGHSGKIEPKKESAFEEYIRYLDKQISDLQDKKAKKESNRDKQMREKIVDELGPMPQEPPAKTAADYFDNKPLEEKLLLVEYAAIETNEDKKWKTPAFIVNNTPENREKNDEQRRKTEIKNKLKTDYGYTDSEIEAGIIYAKRAKRSESANEYYSEVKREATEHPVATSIASIPNSVFGGTLGLVDKAIQLPETIKLAVNAPDTEDTFDLNYSPLSVPANYARTVRQTVAENHDWKPFERSDNAVVNALGLDNADMFDFGYNLLMSGADSAFAAATGGAVDKALGGPMFGKVNIGNHTINLGAGGTALGMGAANEEIINMTEKGAGASQALMSGVAAGIFEMFFEDISISEMRSFKNIENGVIGTGAQGVKDFFEKTLASAFTNASEEGLTEIANILYDTLVNGGYSDYQTSVTKYMSNGFPEEEARKRAAIDLGLRVAESTASGFAMGTAFGAGASAENAILNSDIRNQYRQELKVKAETGTVKDKLSSMRGVSGKEITNVLEAEGKGSKAEMPADDKIRYLNPVVKTVDGKNVAIDKITNIEDGKITAKLTDGKEEVVILSDIKNPNIQKLWRTATAKFSDPETATAAIKGYTEDTSSRSIESYLAAFNIAYKAGKADWSFGSNMLDAAKREIGVSLAKMAFDLGSDELESARTNFNTEMPKEVGFHNLADLSAIKINSQRKAVERQAYLMDGIAKLTGLSITLVDSGKVNGVNKNGLYRTGTNQIVIALNGSAVESNWITRTAGHETYHFIENFDKENGTNLAESLKDTVIAFYTEAKGEKWVNDHIAKTYANYSDDQRMSEFTADAMFNVFTSKRACEELAKKDMNAFEKLYEHIKQLAESIRNYFTSKLGNKSNYEDIAVLSKDAAKLEEIANKMFDALQTIKESGGGKNAAEPGKNAAYDDEDVPFSTGRENEIDTIRKMSYNQYRSEKLAFEHGSSPTGTQRMFFDSRNKMYEVWEKGDDGIVLISKTRLKSEAGVLYERTYRTTANTVYECTESFKNAEGQDNWDSKFSENGRDSFRDVAKIEGERLQSDSRGSGSYLPESDSGQSVTTEKSKQRPADNGEAFSNAQNSFSTSRDYETNPIYALDMSQAKDMLQRAFNAANVLEYYDGEFKNGDEWLKSEGIGNIALEIESNEALYKKFIEGHPGWVEGEFTTEDVLQAYLDGTLVGRPKETAKRLDVSNDTGVKDNRFYSPKAIQNAKAQFEIAKQKITNSNREAITKARADILFFAHEKGAAAALGVSDTELNKLLRQWSRYSSRAREASIKINEGAAVTNRWTGIENLSILNRQTVTADEIRSMVKSVEGSPSDFEIGYIGRTMLSLDTHIDWSWLNFKFGTKADVNVAHHGDNKGNVYGFFDNRKALIYTVKDGNTVAHEMGHALDAQWGREVTGGKRSLYLTELSLSDDTIVTPKVKRWVNNFNLFMQDITDSADIQSRYTQKPTETFARFVDKFVEWNEVISTGRRVFFGYDYNDKFTTKQFVEFARLLQEKSALSVPIVARKNSDNGNIYSTARDAEYFDAIEKYGENSKQVAKLVRQAAEENGYDSPDLWHGTMHFGFTKFALELMDDGQSIFLTSDPKMAESYSSAGGTRKIKEFVDVDKLDGEKLAEAINKAVKDNSYEIKYKFFTEKTIEQFNKYMPKQRRAVAQIVDEAIKKFADKLSTDFNDSDYKVHNQLVKLQKELKSNNYIDASTTLYILLHHTEAFDGYEKSALKEYEKNTRISYEITRKIYLGDMNVSNGVYLREELGGYDVKIVSPGQAREFLRGTLKQGNYALKAKLGKSLVIDANGANWNNIHNWREKFAKQFNERNTKIERDGDYVALLTRDPDDYRRDGKYLFSTFMDERHKEENLYDTLGDEIDGIRDFYDNYSDEMKDREVHRALLSALPNLLKTYFADTGNRTREIADFAKRFGYDSVVFKNLYDDGGRSTGEVPAADVYVIFDPNSVKSLDPVTYDDDGNIIPLSERFNSEKEDIRYSTPRDSENLIDRYTEKEYNARGWVAVNKVITVAESKSLYSQFADFKKNGFKYPVTKSGEACIIVNDDKSESTHLVLIKGTIKSPTISSVVSVNAEDYAPKTYLLEEARYEGRVFENISYFESVDGEKLFTVITCKDYGTFSEISRTAKQLRKSNSYSTARSSAGQYGTGNSEQDTTTEITDKSSSNGGGFFDGSDTVVSSALEAFTAKSKAEGLDISDPDNNPVVFSSQRVSEEDEDDDTLLGMLDGEQKAELINALDEMKESIDGYREIPTFEEDWESLDRLIAGDSESTESNQGTYREIPDDDVDWDEVLDRKKESAEETEEDFNTRFKREGIENLFEKHGKHNGRVRYDKIDPLLKKVINKYQSKLEKTDYDEIKEKVLSLFKEIAEQKNVDWSSMFDKTKDIATILIERSYALLDTEGSAADVLDLLKPRAGGRRKKGAKMPKLYVDEATWKKNPEKYRSLNRKMQGRYGYALTTNRFDAEQGLDGFLEGLLEAVRWEGYETSEYAEMDTDELIDFVTGRTIASIDKEIDRLYGNPYKDTEDYEGGIIEATFDLLNIYFDLSLDKRSPQKILDDEKIASLRAKLDEAQKTIKEEQAVIAKKEDELYNAKMDYIMADNGYTGERKKNAKLESENQTLSAELAEITALAQKHADEIEILKRRAKEKLDDQKLADDIYFGAKSEQIKRRLKENYQQKLSELKAKHKSELDALKAKLKTQSKAQKEASKEKLDDTKEYYKALLKRQREYQDAKRKAQIKAVREAKDLRHQKAMEKAKETVQKGKDRDLIKKYSRKIIDRLISPGDALSKRLPEVFRNDIIEFCSVITQSGVFSYKTSQGLKRALDRINRGELSGTIDSDYQSLYSTFDLEMFGDVTDISETLEGRRLSQLSADELEKVKEAVESIYHMIYMQNKAFSLEVSKNISEMQEKAYKEIHTQPKNRRRFESSFITGMIKPVDFFDMLGSDELRLLFDNVKNGQYQWYKVIEEAAQKRREIAKKYHYSEWKDSKVMYNTPVGNPIEMTIEEALSVIATSEREQGLQHLEVGGFFLEREAETRLEKIFGKSKKNNKGIDIQHFVIGLNKETLEELKSQITDDQLGYMRNIRDYLSSDMAALGNIVSLQLYGMKKFRENRYYPLSVAKDYHYNRYGANDNSEARIKHMSMTKPPKPDAKNPVVISGFSETAMTHCSNMGLYYGLALPIEDFTRVYNYSEYADGTVRSLRTEIKKVYGENATNYISELLRNINGSRGKDPGGTLISKMVSRTKKNAVFGSLSVAIQQPSAIGRAMLYIDPKYFVKSAVQKRDYDELMKYAPVAGIKSMGFFDTSVGRNAIDWMLDDKPETFTDKLKALVSIKDGSYRDEVLSRLPSLMDEMTWAHIWNAVKEEIAVTHKEVEKGSDLFFALAADRFTYIIEHTQVYDSVFARSQLMRSKDTGAQMLTAFMAEPLTNFNMLVSSATKALDGDKKIFMRALGSYVFTIVLNGMLKSLVTAARKKDDDESYLEKYLSEAVGNIVLEPLQMIPYVREALTLMQGYNVDRIDATAISDIVSAVKATMSDKKSLYQKLQAIAGAVGIAVGVPIKNLWRDIEAIIRVCDNIRDMITGDYDYATAEGIGEAVKEAVKDDVPFADKLID